MYHTRILWVQICLSLEIHYKYTRWAQKPVISRGPIAPRNRGEINASENALFSAIDSGPITLLITVVEAHLTVSILSFCGRIHLCHEQLECILVMPAVEM